MYPIVPLAHARLTATHIPLCEKVHLSGRGKNITSGETEAALCDSSCAKLDVTPNTIHQAGSRVLRGHPVLLPALQVSHLHGFLIFHLFPLCPLKPRTALRFQISRSKLIHSWETTGGWTSENDGPQLSSPAPWATSSHY